jgi:hypothetical protein
MREINKFTIESHAKYQLGFLDPDAVGGVDAPDDNNEDDDAYNNNFEASEEDFEIEHNSNIFEEE